MIVSRKAYLNQVGGRPVTNFWPFEETGHTDEASRILKVIFNGTAVFDTPKPPRLIERVIQIATDENSIVLDSFAGSGTTAHAILNMNKKDGGHRKFILVEMGDYADSITAERVRRVIKGYGEGNKAVEGTGGDFSFYELGEPLFKEDGNLNEKAGVKKIREYIWYTETKTPYIRQTEDNPYYLGSLNGTGYYFFYKADEATTLNYDFLSTIHKQEESYVIFADSCSLSDKELMRMNIAFRKIPRDISRV